MQIPLKVKGQQVEIVAGIDLGTTNSLCAWVHDGAAKIVEDRAGRRITPSVINIDTEHHGVVGDDAQERALMNPEGHLTSIKRFMGRSLGDVYEEAKAAPYKVVSGTRTEQCSIRVHGKEYVPEELSAMILAEVKKRAERGVNGRLRRAVITVPAYFDDSQRQATRNAGRMAGIDVLRIINEPTAAALAYGLNDKKSGTVLVYDLGGGTFDVSVLKITEGVFKVIATAGNTALGGDDFDRALVELITAGVEVEKKPQFAAALKIAAESAKKALSSQDETRVQMKLGETSIDQTIDRATYEAAIKPLVQKTIEAVEFVLDESGLDPEDISDVVCVGGSTRTPMVRAELEEYFGKPPHTGLNPDEVVALGAAVQANILSGDGTSDTVLLDVTPLSLGIETYGGGCTKLLWRNSPIPVRATEGFTTHVDDQTAVAIHVLQGEREMAADLRSLGRFVLRGIPKMNAGMPRVLVEFFIDADGVLKVTAKEMTSGTEASIDVQPTYGLTDEQVEDMIFDSIEHAEEDMLAHIVADLKSEAESVIRYSRKAMVEREDLIPPPLKIQIEAAIGGLEAAIETGEKEVIEVAMEVLNESTAPVAETLMNEVLSVTVQGKSVGEVIGTEPRTKASDIQLG
jgi:molecular chaperone DnaK